MRYLYLICILYTGVTHAQINYRFTASTGTYTNLTAADSINAIESDDAISGVIPIGFTFNYNGINYTKVVVSSNGWLTFDTTTYTSNLSNNLTSGTPRPLVAPLWDDLSGYSGNAYFKTIGTSPNRIFTVECRDWLWDYSSSSPSISYQIQLLEGSNKVRFIYRQESGTPSSWSGASIGICAIGTGNSNFISLTNSGANPGTSTTIETSNITSRPATGQIYEFSPLICVGPSTFVATRVNPTTANISFTSTNPGDTFFLEYGVKGFTRGTGILVKDTSKAMGIQRTISGLLPTYYDFYLFEKCSSTDTSLIGGPYPFDNTPDLNYLFRAYSDVFVPLSSGTSMSAIQTDDAISGVIPIGFSFEYHGKVYSKMQVSSNGWATFDTNTYNNTLTNDLSDSDTNIRPLLAPLWDDVSGSNGTASYQTLGTAPNRIFVIECLNWLWNYGASSASISYQIRLYETTQTIRFVYRQESGTNNYPSASIGIAARATGGGKFMSLNSAGPSPSFSRTTETDTITQRPASGQVYEFRPDTTGDVGVIALLSPDNGICGSNKMPVKLVIKNFGSNVQSYIPVEVRVTGAHTANISYFYNGTLSPGSTDTLLVGLLNATSGGAHTILAYTNSPGEVYRPNDSLRVSHSFLAGISVDLSNDTSYCANTTFTYTLGQSAPPGATYRWQDNSSGGTYTVTTSGIYWLELTATGGCKAADTIRVTTDTVPVITFPAPASQCLNSPALVLNTAQPAGGTYSGTSMAGSVFHPSVAGLGLHIIRYQYTDLKNCTGKDSVTILVDTLPQVSFSSPAPICQSSTLFQLTTGTPSGGYYSGPRVSANYYVPNRVGTDTLLYIRIGANQCRDTAKAAVFVVAAPTVSLAPFPALCNNSPVYNFVEGSPTGGTYSGTGVSGSSFNPTASGAGTYNIAYAYTDHNGCSAIAYRNLSINPIPTVSFTHSLDTCHSQQPIILIGGLPAGGVYSGNFVSSGQFLPSSSGPGLFAIRYSYKDANQCSDSTTGNLEIFANPSQNLPATAVACPKISVVLDAGNAGSTYLWSTGDNKQTLSVSTAGTYSVKVTSTHGCLNYDTTEVRFDEICTGLNPLSQKIPFRLYPNPARTHLTFQFENLSSEKVRLRLLTYSGIEVRSEYLNQLGSGDFTLPLEGISSGSYLLEIIVNQHIVREKLEIIR